MFSAKRILLDGLQLMPSPNYACVLNGLVGNFEKTQDIANLMSDGGIVGNSKINVKKINIEVNLKNDDMINYLNLYRIAQKRKALIQVEYDVIGVVETYIYVDSVATDRDKSKIAMIGTVENPYIECNETKEIYLGEIRSGGVVITENNSKFPIVFNETISGNEGIVTNNCMCTCWSIVEIKGSCSDIKIINNTTQEGMKINVELGANDVLTIDSRPSTRGIYLNGEPRPDLKDVEDKWISIVEGENLFTFNNTSIENGVQHCKVMFKERWI